MSLLVLSIVALALGPGIVTLAGARSWVLSLVDGFVIVTIGGIALIHILPDALLSCGAWALVAATLGLLGPMLLERKNHAHDADGHGVDAAGRHPALALALVGIAMHAFLDGSAFAEHDEVHSPSHAHGSSELLGLAVVLHRIPEGLAIWWLVRRRRGGLKMALLALALVATATVLGSRFGDALVHGTRAPAFAFVQAVVAGSLLHVVTHHAPASMDARGHHHAQVAPSPSRAFPPAHDRDQAHAHHPHRRLQVAPALGAFAGMALLYVVSTSHPTAQRIANEIAMGPTFLTLLLACAPAFVLACVASGVVHALFPRSLTPWRVGGGPLSQSLRGLLVGPLLPMEPRKMLRFHRSIVARGTSRALALTLLVSTPELGLATFLVSWSLLGGRLTVVRVMAVVVTALVAGYGVIRLAPPDVRAETPASVLSSSPAPSLGARLWAGVRYGLGDTIDQMTPWIVMGLTLAALAEPLLDGDVVARLSPWIDVPVFALLGVPIYVSAAGATPLMAVLLHKGVSPGAAIAFLLTGPAMNLATFGVLKSVHGKKVAVWFAAVVAVVPMIIGWLANIGLPRDRSEALHRAAHEPATMLEIASLVVLVVLAAVSLLRHGPRHMVSQLMATSDDAH